MKYLLTGGGTGGHVYPALAIADEIRRRQPEARFLYVGLRDKLEAQVVPGRGYPIQFVRARAFPRTFSPWALARFAVALGLGTLKGMLILWRFRPRIIVGTGGYASAPILLAHGLLSKIGLSGARVFLYEPNAHPGLLNQAVGRLAQRIGVAFEQAGRWFDMRRVAVVGYPVRREFLEINRAQARRRLGIAPERKVVLAFGGSSGARAINQALVEALPLLRQCPDLLVLHVTGRYQGPDYDAVGDTERALGGLGLREEELASWYWRYAYLDNIHEAYAAADLVICRGGAGTLTEVSVCGVPALIVPLPTAAEDHQAVNARELERRGAARILYQEACWEKGRVFSRLDGGKLAGQVRELFAEEEQRKRMAKAARSLPVRDGLELILGEIEHLAVGQRPPRLSLEFPSPVGSLPAEPNALLRWVRERLRQVGGVEGADRCELAYLRYQADRLLVYEDWCEIPLGWRNVGVKLVGLLHYRERLPLLRGILLDRTPVGLGRRLLGGDFRHGGILRRNVVELGIRMLGATDEETRRVLLEALRSDPYFEVRAAAAQVLGELFPPDPASEAALMQALDDDSPAVVVQALEALGAVGQSAQLLERLRQFRLHPDWQFRRGMVQALSRLVQRGVLSSGQVVPELDQILATSPHFIPEFPLDESLRGLAELVRGREEQSLK
jgi:UDP-N-acetylglucosamine--N-acetylmuramyl-(pentapeptide) pyrophosphoryl-undecaprenol N-acetylglucosamine transferase